MATEAGESSGTQSEGNVHRWNPLPSNGSEDTSVCVCVIVNTKL
jgi:hypothetical protein